MENNATNNPELPPTDDQLIADGIAWAEHNRMAIPDSTARRIAMQHHDGQTSALYAFGSSGAIDGETLQSEVVAGMRGAALTPEGERSVVMLGRLAEYFDQSDDRGPVDSWWRLTADNAPAVMWIEQLRPEQYIGTYHTPEHLAFELLQASGLYRQLNNLSRLMGKHIMQYVKVDVDAYAAELHANVRMAENSSGEIDAFWRL